MKHNEDDTVSLLNGDGDADAYAFVDDQTEDSHPLPTPAAPVAPSTARPRRVSASHVEARIASLEAETRALAGQIKSLTDLYARSHERYTYLLAATATGAPALQALLSAVGLG